MKGVVLVVLLGGFGLCLKAVRAFQLERADYHPTRSQVRRPADARQFAALQDVWFETVGRARMRGWLIPTTNGAAVILTHGSGSDRRQLLPEAGLLAKYGFGVLLFDWPGHGESDGAVVLGEPERQALQGAVDYLVKQPGVDPGRIGAVGFSIGSAIALQVAARDPRLRALVLEGAYTNSNELARVQSGWLMQWPVRLAGLMAGTNGVQPIDAIRQLGHRRVLVIAGSSDRAVPPAISRRLYEAAEQPKEFWLVPDAGHGDYAAVAPDFGPRLAKFFQAALATK
ncbi:MAG: alpha/beta fold hydrolase [Vicinamibacterales bacterium]